MVCKDHIYIGEQGSLVYIQEGAEMVDIGALFAHYFIDDNDDVLYLDDDGILDDVFETDDTDDALIDDVTDSDSNDLDMFYMSQGSQYENMMMEFLNDEIAISEMDELCNSSDTNVETSNDSDWLIEEDEDILDEE